jgi:hypothetical protein
MIIGICGLIGAGKDTAADYLVNFHEFRRDSFAATLKDAVAAVFGWNRELLEGRTKAAREWREEIDPWWSKRLAMPNLTPRFVLQQWGTEVCRKTFHDDIWIASLENKLRKCEDDVVISDCRFPNEMTAIRNAGGRVIRIRRGSDPLWFDMARKTPDLIKEFYPDVHASEYSWASTDFDLIIDNEGSIEDLYTELKNLV